MNAQQTDTRSPRAVLLDHLEAARSGGASFEDDMRRNYAEEVVVLGDYGVHRGYAGMHDLDRLLQQQVPNARFSYLDVQVDGELGFLRWTAEGDGAWIEDGADSYLIRDGRIVGQTIHYTVRRAEPELRAEEARDT